MQCRVQIKVAMREPQVVNRKNENGKIGSGFFNNTVFNIETMSTWLLYRQIFEGRFLLYKLRGKICFLK